ncbi:MAG: type II toxin-antitoxin system VapC family toxin [Lautropia sp.]|nr:type II toxin-antitoxin system VapC family toxin [Lautropia sp.]
MYLLDTNVISELRKAEKGRADPQVMQWFRSVKTRDTWLSVISLVELKIGILRLGRRDPTAAQGLNDWFEHRLLPAYQDRILTLDFHAAMLCAALHIPDKSPLNDAYIAAIAKAHHLSVVTRNTQDFERFDVGLLNPFQL